MPQLPLASALLRSLPWLSPRGRATINFLVCDNGRVASADSLAARLGLRNRYQLARLLRAEGLPPYDDLTSWISLLFWRLEAERTQSSLVDLAQRSHVAPETSYRIVRRITGGRWTDIRNAPTEEVLRRFVAQCDRRRNAELPAVAPPAVAPAPAPAVATAAPTRDRMPLAGAPFSIALYGPRTAYISRGLAAAIERLDITARRYVGSIPAGSVPSCIAIDPVRPRAYASVQYEDAIAVIDTQSHRVVGMLPLPGDPFPVLVDGTGNRLYAATNEDRLHAVALPGGRITASLSLPATSHFLTLHPAGHRLYVATRSGGTVLDVEVPSLRVHRTFAPGGEPLDMRVSGDGRFLYVANGRQGLNVYRLADGHLLRTVAFAGRPVHMAMSPDERTVFVAQVEGGAVAAVDRQGLTVRFIQTGGRPRGMVVTRERELLIANEAGWVDVVAV